MTVATGIPVHWATTWATCSAVSQFLLPGGHPGPVRQLPQGGWQHLSFHSQAGAALVDKVNGLVGQEPLRQIPSGQVHRRGERLVGDGQVVMLLVSAADAPQNLQSLFPGGLSHRHRLEAPL